MTYFPPNPNSLSQRDVSYPETPLACKSLHWPDVTDLYYPKASPSPFRSLLEMALRFFRDLLPASAPKAPLNLSLSTSPLNELNELSSSKLPSKLYSFNEIYSPGQPPAKVNRQTPTPPTTPLPGFNSVSKSASLFRDPSQASTPEPQFINLNYVFGADVITKPQNTEMDKIKGVFEGVRDLINGPRRLNSSSCDLFSNGRVKSYDDYISELNGIDKKLPDINSDIKYVIEKIRKLVGIKQQQNRDWEQMSFTTILTGAGFVGGAVLQAQPLLIAACACGVFTLFRSLYLHATSGSIELDVQARLKEIGTIIY